MTLQDIVDIGLDGYRPASPDPLAAAMGSALKTTTWSWRTPAGDGECPHGLSEPAWCGFCTPPAPGGRRAR